MLHLSHLVRSVIVKATRDIVLFILAGLLSFMGHFIPCLMLSQAAVIFLRRDVGI